MALIEQDLYDYKLMQQARSSYTYEVYLELFVMSHLRRSLYGLWFSCVDLHSYNGDLIEPFLSLCACEEQLLRFQNVRLYIIIFITALQMLFVNYMLRIVIISVFLPKFLLIASPPPRGMLGNLVSTLIDQVITRSHNPLKFNAPSTIISLSIIMTC